MKKIKGKLTFANLTAGLALFVALGGVSYAATQLPANSVGTAQIKKNAVTPAKLSPAARRPQPAIAIGPKGDPGPRGPQGERGPQGVSGLSGVVTRYGGVAQLPTSAATLSYSACNPGESVLGGGWSFVNSQPSSNNYKLTVDRPSVKIANPSVFYPAPGDGQAATGWAVSFENNTGDPFEFQSYVQCAVPPTS